MDNTITGRPQHSPGAPVVSPEVDQAPVDEDTADISSEITSDEDIDLSDSESETSRPSRRLLPLCPCWVYVSSAILALVCLFGVTVVLTLFVCRRGSRSTTEETEEEFVAPPPGDGQDDFEFELERCLTPEVKSFFFFPDSIHRFSKVG